MFLISRQIRMASGGGILGLSSQRRTNSGQVMMTVPNGMLLQTQLAGEGSFAIRATKARRDPGLHLSEFNAYRFTVTRRKVAGMEVPPLALVFCDFASSTS